MKVRIDIPQVYARRVTHPRTDADEVYLAYFVTLAKPNGNNTLVRKYITKKISEVRYGVKNKSRWMPADTDVEIDVDDAEAMFVTIALYEYDNGAIYKELKDKSEVVVNPKDFEWTSIELPADLTNWFGWVKSVWKVVVSSFNYFMQDDLIDVQSVDIPQLQNENKRNWEGIRELKFKRYGGDYRVSLVMMVMEE